MKRWRLYLDDVRDPEDGTWKWTIARSVYDALYLIESNGFPVSISFDHDLGENVATGYDFAKMIMNMVLDGEVDIPEDFSYTVHSSNPPGAENIDGLMKNILKYVREQR